MRFTLLAAAGLLMLTGCQLGHYAPPKKDGRVIRADVVALDQPLTYNRFGSFNPYGMIYALANDVDIEDVGFDSDKLRIGREREDASVDIRSICPGQVRLKDGVRPRPLVLRGNQGDRLQVRFTNYLLPRDRRKFGPSGQPNLSRCYWNDIDAAEPIQAGYPFPPPYPYDDYDLDHGNLRLEARLEAAEEDAEAEAAEHGEEEVPTADDIIGEEDSTNFPRTRTASFVASGLTVMRGAPCYAYDAEPDNPAIWLSPSDPRVTGIQPIPPGACFVYEYILGEPGTHLFFSLGAPSGGQGDGGSLTHGLFGSVNVQPAGSEVYRSQVTADVMEKAKDQARGKALINYHATDDDGTSLLDMLQRDPAKPHVYDLVHGDLNAIVVDCGKSNRKAEHCRNVEQAAFREFTVIFHDELKTFYPEPLKELGEEYQLEGVGDGFAINYGASGMGSILLANRKGFGPAQNCLECLYEEFFLQSWANGDPALLVNYPDDPANVHHSYLGDRVEFRNLHAGPKETHVFHLHAHQWLAQQDDPTKAENFGTYLDSQTIAPQQGFAYNIFYGGSGNRNQTVGDSIFHCHLYPHFAQGMWALWRVHDVFEDGTRRLPDGEAGPGTNAHTGVTDGGTPIPALVPLPRQAMPPLPTYAADVGEDEAMPGYPFYIPGRAGHRAPQPPLDMARNETGEWLDGGMPRHVFADGGARVFGELEPDEQAAMSPEDLVQYALRTGDFSVDVQEANIDLLDNAGETSELAAMAFHAGQSDGMVLANGTYKKKRSEKPGYPSITPEGKRSRYIVNNAPAAPGAPFADPCRADLGRYGDPIEDSEVERLVRYDVSAIQLDLIVNKAGWHDPQARINVLSRDAKALEYKTTGDVDPFFFRANSRDCIEFRHTNRTPKDLELDDFQVKTPTDVIGQHIHLVKFDVTSSDGSGNGFNYEDGTLAPDEVEHRIDLYNESPAGAADPLKKPADTHQTTVQRWYADPLLSGEDGSDRTIRTVFTHDHFAPSSIQHHGFYSALLVEPEGSTWRTADGRVMCPELVDGAEVCDLPAVGARAVITDANDPNTHPDHREFAMAIADFGLLYEPHRSGEPDDQGLDNLVAGLDEAPIDGVSASRSDELIAPVKETLADMRARHGRPVDPPLLPESISKNHHNPYLVNYRNEPPGLRIGKNGPERRPDVTCDDRIRNRLLYPESVSLVSLRDRQGEIGDAIRLENEESVREQDTRIVNPLQRGAGDMSQLFNSKVHGDPCTPLVEGYVGETVQLRMIQGAQEVQHMFEAQSLSWPREIANREGPRVAAQEIGISEHFEMQLPALNPAAVATPQTDYLYRFSTVDDLWNGAWGLLRAYEGTDKPDRRCTGTDCETIGGRLAAVAEAAGVPPDVAELPDNDYRPGLAARTGTCPADAPVRLHVVDAVTVSDVLGRDDEGRRRRLLYNPDHSIADWDALAFMPVHSRTFGSMTAAELQLPAGLGLADDLDEADSSFIIDAEELAAAIRNGRIAAREAMREAEVIEPLTLRARAGECVVVRLRNLLRHPIDETTGEIAFDDDGNEVLLRADIDDNDDVEPHVEGGEGYDPRHLPRIMPLNAVELQASDLVGLSPQKMHHNVDDSGGVNVGRNSDEDIHQMARPGRTFTYVWYAGEATAEPAGVGDNGEILFQKTWTCRVDDDDCDALGAVNLVSLADVIEHGQQGLIGALIVEEREATVYDTASGNWVSEPLPHGTRARIDPDGDGERRPFHEFVLMYQDGLNLRWRNPERPYNRSIEAVPDCLVCDDSYDRGEKAVNYRTEPFWARLRQHPTTDLNGVIFDERLFLDDWKTIATPGFQVEAGDAVTFHVLQPYGRARQRAFMVLGHDYLDLLPLFGSRHSALISVGKAIEAELSTTVEPRSHQAAKGDWIWRDGPAQHFSSGAWGQFEVKAR